MPRNEKRHQKAQERKSAKRKERRNDSAAPDNRVRKEIKVAATWPIHECLISEDWNTPGALFELLVTRRSPSGEIGISTFLVDLCCLGVRAARTGRFDNESEFSQHLQERQQDERKLQPCSTDLATRILREAVSYAQGLGFKPPRDYYDAVLLLGGEGDADAAGEAVPLGKDGRPYYIAGPQDNPWAVIGQLERSVGAGNFDYEPFDGQESDELDMNDPEMEWQSFIEQAQSNPPRSLPVDLAAIDAALADTSDTEYFLDYETGSVLKVEAEAVALLEQAYQIAFSDEAEELMPFEDALSSLALPEPANRSVAAAHEISQNIMVRYLPLPSGAMPEVLAQKVAAMREFVASVDDAGLSGRLEQVLSSEPTPDTFQAEFANHPDIAERWRTFLHDRLEAETMQFMTMLNIEPTTVSSAS